MSDAKATTKMSRLSSYSSSTGGPAAVAGGGGRLSGSADPTTTTSILVEGVPFSTIPHHLSASSTGSLWCQLEDMFQLIVTPQGIGKVMIQLKDTPSKVCAIGAELFLSKVPLEVLQI